MSYSVSTSFLLRASCPQLHRLLNKINLFFPFFIAPVFPSCPLFPSTLRAVTHLFCLPREEEEGAPQPINIRNTILEGQHLCLSSQCETLQLNLLGSSDQAHWSWHYFLTAIAVEPQWVLLSPEWVNTQTYCIQRRRSVAKRWTICSLLSVFPPQFLIPYLFNNIHILIETVLTQ